MFEKVARKHWILTLGIDESWRETQSISPEIFYYLPGVCINGFIYRFIYWFAKDNRPVIAAFDIKSEKLNILALWSASHHCIDDYKLIEVKGKLAVIDIEKWLSGYIRLWIYENTQKEDRRKSHEPQLSPPRSKKQEAGFSNSLSKTESECDNK
ncbi:putative F-box protein At4g38870 [Lycium barbarum]|uniref:putative F-box protein At4g38870 n=1 Tax=Lycium barbarum TaxID=112863 RepID=UPI00293E0721|nr:putative F-box protein At4g38870 [Lycium barbarum]